MLSTGVCSLIQFYPNFENQLRDSLRRLVGQKVEEAVEIGMAKDGSGVGGKPNTHFPSQRAMLKLFISCLGCPHSHTSLSDLVCNSPKNGLRPRDGRFV